MILDCPNLYPGVASFSGELYGITDQVHKDLPYHRLIPVTPRQIIDDNSDLMIKILFSYRRYYL